MVLPKRILITRTDKLGDVVLSTPVIENLRTAFPKAYIAFMCRPYTADVLRGNPYLDEVIVYDKYGKQHGFFASLKFALKIRKKRFDWAILLHPTNRVHLMAFIAGIPFRAGWDKKMGFLLTKKVPHTKQEGKKHERDYTLGLLREIGVSIKSINPFVPKQPEAESWADNFFGKKGLNSRKIIALGIGASCPSRIWPTERYIELGKRLNRETGAKILLLGVKEERKLIAPFLKEIDTSFIDLIGGCAIPQLVSLFRRINLLIANDSGLSHLCSASGTQVLTLFGRNQPGISPTRWHTLGENDLFIHKNVGCKVCLAHNCEKGFKCLKAISVDEVFNLAVKMLK